MRVTTTSTDPAAPAGAVTVICVAVVATTVAGLFPNSTVAPCWKLDPATLTVVPPAVEPAVGEMLEIVGEGL